jgi:hypothetical protein
MKGERYTQQREGEESRLSKNIREMIEMMKTERVSTNPINYNNLRMTNHSVQRVMEYFKCNENECLDKVKDILSKSERIGEQLAFDGRINVMFSYKQYAIYLSPNLKHIITVHKFQRVSYNPIREMLPTLQEKFQGEQLRRHLVKLHRDAWEDIEKRESKQVRKVMEIDRELNNQLKKINKGYAPKFITSRIEEERSRLYVEGKKLFEMKLEKRHVGKSLTSVI